MNDFADLTPGSENLLRLLVLDAGNWGGSPGFGCNVGHTPEDRGYLTHLKKCDYVKTCEDDTGVAWVYFTEKGRAWTAENHPDQAPCLAKA